MANKLRALEIHPGENGGHRVVHEFERTATKRGGAMSGGMYMERPEPEEHLFGKGEDTEMLAHVAKHLKLDLPSHLAKGLKLKNEGGERMHTAKGSEEESGEDYES